MKHDVEILVTIPCQSAISAEEVAQRARNKFYQSGVFCNFFSAIALSSRWVHVVRVATGQPCSFDEERYRDALIKADLALREVMPSLPQSKLASCYDALATISQLLQPEPNEQSK